jgi:hypothetical protein
MLWSIAVRSVGPALLSLLVAAACGDNLGPEPEPDPRLDTVAPAEVRAGDSIEVTCLMDRGNDVIEAVAAEIRVTPEDAVDRSSGQVTARVAGEVEVACVLADPPIVDPRPAVVMIVPGAAAVVATEVTPNPATAGDTVTATCAVFDRFGNRIDDVEPTFGLVPEDPGNQVDGLGAYVTRAGTYDAACRVPGAAGDGVPLEVVPGLPASIALGAVPAQAVYAVGDVVEITHNVVDRFDNAIFDATVLKSSTPVVGTGPIVTVSPDEFQYDGEGRFRIDAVVDPPTEGDEPVEASIEILVNSLGPGIRCESPGDTAMVNVFPGSAITIRGTAEDVNGVQSVLVDGEPATLAGDGSFSAPFTTRFGMNFVEVVATDDVGAETSVICTFLAANQWASPAGQQAGTVTLKLLQAAWDDNNRGGPFNDFTDILYRVVNSSGVRSTVHSALLAANPLKPASCDSQTCVPLLGCACNYSSEVIYRSSRFDGPNTSSMQLVSNGVRAQARLNNPGFQVRVHGKITLVSYDITGWVNMDYVNVVMTLNTTVSGGRPRINIRPGSVSVQVGQVSTDFSGLDGFFVNIVVSLFQGTVRNLIANTLRDFISTNFNAILDDLVGNLDISSLGSTIQVPRLGGGPAIPLSFSLGFSSLATSSSRMLFGISTRFTAPISTSYPTLGIPLPPGTIAGDPSTATPATVSAHVGIFNQVLHALWRAGMFEASLSGDQLPGSPQDASVSLTTFLPPVVHVDGSQVVAHLGGVQLSVNHPDLPDDLSVSLGATARTSVTLVGEDLVFGGFTLDEFHLSAAGLSGSERTTLEDLLQPLIQVLLDQVLNDALPSVPLPTFTIPASLATYGLSAGGQFGLTAPLLTTTPQHFILRGGFGIR